MADERSVSVSTSSASSLPLEVARLASDEDVTARRKQQRSEATRIYLGKQHKRWRDLLQELSLKSDKELSAILLDEYMAHKERHFR